MNNTTEEQTQIGERDRAITQHLLSNNIIEDDKGLIGKCGDWINFEPTLLPPQTIKCNNHSCRTCRRERIEKLQLKHYLLNKEFREIGGHILLFTLTIHHTKEHTLPFLHERFTKSLSQMKGGRGWKKLKDMTDYIYHYDNIEIQNTNNSGHHYHDHLTYGYINDDVSINEIQDQLFNTWNHYTRKNGLRSSKKYLDVSPSLYGGHSRSRSVKSIEESEGIKGTLEYWESVSREYENQPNYIHPDKTPEEVMLEIKDLNKIFSKSKRGRIERDRNIPTPYIPFNQDTYTKEDLDNYHSVYRTVITGNFKDLDIISMSPPSSGGVLLIQMLNMLEQYPLDTLGWNSSDYIHLLTEIERRAYADRAEHMGDPDFWEVPVSMLVSKEYAFERIQNISMEKATKSSVVKAGDPLAYESRETTHYSVIDKNGNAVSVTTTLNTGFGCGVLVEGAGFFLNNEMDDFSAKPGIPNIFGLIGNEANAIQPYKRPLSSMTPTIVLKNGEPFLIIGTPGGSTIITTVMQIILNVAIHGMDIQEAVSVPRIHSQWFPDAIIVEERSLSKDVEQNLINRGHTIRPYRWSTIGQANGIMIGEKGFYGGADPRGENATEGY